MGRTLALFVLLVTMPLSSCKHFNCANVCADAGRDPPGPDQPSGSKATEEVEHGETKCFGSFCAVLTPDYSHIIPPEPYRPSVMGTRLNRSGECVKAAAASPLNVITDLDVLEVSGIDQEEGKMDLLAKVKLTWYEPNMGFCACAGHLIKEKYKLNLNLDEFIWTPNLVVHDSMNFRTTSGLRKLGALEISLANHCATKVTKIFDFQVTIMCPMAMGYYPLDRNICQLKLGSGTHPARRIQFHMDNQRIHHTFEDWKLRDLLFQSSPMCPELELVDEQGKRGVPDTYKTAGLNIIMTRRSLAVVLEYILCTFTLTFTAMLSITLHNGSSRATLVASLVLSSVFIYTTAATSTPQGEFNLNLVQLYVMYNIGFIAIAFVWICCGHMFKSHQHQEGVANASRLCSSLRTLFKRDMYCAGCLFIAVVMFNIAFWLRWRYIEGGESCHNELELSRKNMVRCIAL